MAWTKRCIVVVGTLLLGAALCAHDVAPQADSRSDAQSAQIQWPQAQGPQNLALVIDCSARAAKRFEFLRSAAIESVRNLTATDIVSVVVYSDNAAVMVPARAAKNLDEIVAMLAALKPKGDAALFAGMSAAAEELRKNADEKFTNRMFVMNASPGNVGPHTEGELWSFADALAKENIRVFFAGMMRRGGAGGEGRPVGFRGRFGGGRPGGFGVRGFGPPRMRFPRRQPDVRDGEKQAPRE